MKVVFVHTSIKLYWIPRLEALKKSCEENRFIFSVIEITGNSIVYNFDKSKSNKYTWWFCLYPTNSTNELSSNVISKSTYKKLSELNPDIVISGAIPFPCGAISLRWVNDNKKKIIVFDDVKINNFKRNQVVNLIKKKLYSRIDAYFAPSKGYYPDLKFWNFSPERIFTGLSCIDNDSFQKKSIQELTAYNFKEISYNKKNNYIICVARLVPIKNHKNLLLAWDNFNKRNPELNSWQLLLIGNGPLKEELENLVRINRVNNVMFLDFLSQADLPYYYSLAQALILPSFLETWGLVVNEAMASSLPVLVSDQCNCVEDLVKHNKNGYIFNPRSILQIEEAILKIATSSSLQEMGSLSKKIIDGFSLEIFCQNMIQALICVESFPIKKGDLITKILSILWKGKFNVKGFNNN